MTRGAAIVLNSMFRGNWENLVLNDTSKPGTFLGIVAATNPVGGAFLWQARGLTPGSPGPVLILVNDWEQGQTAAANFPNVASTGGHKGYWPLPGDELNALVAESSGTGTSGENNIGDRLAIRADGLLLAGGSLTSQPFYLLDRSSLAAKATALRWVKFLGSYA